MDEPRTGGMGLFPETFSGYSIMSNDAAFQRRVQVRFPRSKKSRILKKWRKRDKNYAYTIDSSVLMDKNSRTMYMHSHTAATLIAVLRER